jgi:uncharacterized phiE125 gp8 family phage protein
MYGLLIVKTPPADAPVTVADAAAHLRLDQEDPVLEGMIAAAMQKIESWTQVTLAKTEYIWTMTEQPPVVTGLNWIQVPFGSPRIELPRYPVQSVDSVVTFTQAGDQTLLDAAAYSVDMSLGPARLNVGSLPWQLSVIFTAGFDDGKAPPTQLLMVKMLTAHLYEHRGDDDAPELPKALDIMLDDYRAAVW